MVVSLFESAIYRELLADNELAQYFSDAAEIRSWLRVEAALAEAQAELGLVPADCAAAIARICNEIAIDPGELAAGAGRDGIPIPALLERLRETLADPHAGYLHFGATTQDIIDTGLVLRLREVCNILDARLELALHALADLADLHAELPLVARTRRRPATATSFGAVVATWGTPLLSQVEALAQLRPRLLRVSLAGAAGNASALGPRAGELRAAFAQALDLAGDEPCWHSDRSALAEFAALLGRITAAFAKIAEDCLFAAAPEVGELRLPAAGGSSTMPHKQNPVQAEILVALHEMALTEAGAMTRAQVHRQQRDGAMWLLEWHALPQLCAACGRALQLGIALLTRLEPDAARMLTNLEGDHGLVHAEAIRFRLAREIPPTEAQAQVKQLCADAVAQECKLVELVAERFPGLAWHDVVDPAAQLGDAPAQARGFAARVRAL